MSVATGSANNHPFETSFDIQSILASESASLEASMTKEQILAIGNHLSRNDVRLIHLSLDQSFKDLQEAVVEFLGLPCCSELQVLEYKAGGSSFGQILLSPSTAPTTNIAPEQLQDEAFIHARIPFAKTLTTLRLGYNSDAAQSKSDIRILNTVLKHFPQLQEFSMSSPLDDFSLFEGLKPTGLKKLSVTINSETGLDGEEAKNRVREELWKDLGEAEQQVEIEIEIEIDERSSSYYLNVSRDRHFQAFIRRFGGERKQ